MWRRCLVVLFLALPSGYLEAQTPRIDNIIILEKGIYRADIFARTERAGTSGPINTVGEVKLLSSTTTIMGVKGVRFGMRYVLTGAPTGADVELKMVTIFPPAGLRDPTTGKTHYHDEHFIARKIGNKSYRDYCLENDWEVVPGVWTFQFW
jgi:hypothetical protein